MPMKQGPTCWVSNGSCCSSLRLEGRPSRQLEDNSRWPSCCPGQHIHYRVLFACLWCVSRGIGSAV